MDKWTYEHAKKYIGYIKEKGIKPLIILTHLELGDENFNAMKDKIATDMDIKDDFIFPFEGYHKAEHR